MGWLRTTGLRVLVHAAAWLPLTWIVWRFAQGNLTANPIREIQLETGRTALTLLLFSLACSPLYHVSGIDEVRKLRRTFGLYAFTYAAFHFVNFIGFDYGFNFPLIIDAIGSKRFPLAGLVSFLVLIPLAVTSTKGWKERLGKNWGRLHRFVYAAAVLGVFHYVWAAKSQADIKVPLIYGAVLAVLLIVRVPVVKRLIGRHNFASSAEK